MRNPDRNFPDLETGIKIKRLAKTQNPLLQGQKNKTLIDVPIEGFTRFLEHYQPSFQEKEQFREEFGEWGTEFITVYFDILAGDHEIIQKDDFVYFNRKSIFKGTECDETRNDLVFTQIKSIPIAGAFNLGLSGVDCGMLEVICYSS